MKAARQGNIIAVRLERGEMIPNVLHELYQRHHDITGAFVHSGIGMLSAVELGYFTGPGRYARKRYEGRYECLALHGTISLYDGQPMAHLHAMLAQEDYSVFGGHLFTAEVGLTAELQVSVVTAPLKMYREVEAESGLPSLLVE